MELVILTAARRQGGVRSVRDGDVHGMRWSEVDHAAKTWTVQSGRMKTGVAHVVPLSDRTMQILDTVGGDARTSELVYRSTERRPSRRWRSQW